MNLQDLQSLKLALDTNNTGLFHGDWATALTEVVDELIEQEEALEDLAFAKDVFEDSIIETFKSCKCVLDEEKEEYTITPHGDGCTLALSHDDLIEGRGYEIILRVIS